MTEQVNHPSHYNQPGKKECIVSMEDEFGPMFVADFCYGNSYKYLNRAGHKEGNSEAQDISKARWYFDYVDNLAIKYKTPGFNLSARSRIEKLLERAERKLKKSKQEE